MMNDTDNATAVASKHDGEQNKAAEDNSTVANKHDGEQSKAAEEEDWKIQLDANKSLGDEAFRSGDYHTAIQHYSAALSLDPDHAVLLSNRSAAYLKTGQKSKALHDAQACQGSVMGLKGISRLAAALHALGRYGPALEQWDLILKQDPSHKVALKGSEDCRKELEKQQEAKPQVEEEQSVKAEKNEQEDDLLGNFFDDVEEATAQVSKEKELAAQPVATDAIKNHKKDLGTAALQIERLLAENYKWRNLNPYFVLDLPHTASADDISRRYKALSLLLHPDKNRDDPDRAQQAFDQVKKAKTKLDDEHKAKHAQQLIEEGLKQGKIDWEKQRKESCAPTESLESSQSKAIQRIFAQAEFNRQQAEKLTRKQDQREQQQEEEDLQKERKSREFDKQWKEETRVDKRIGNWRDFQKKKKSKS